MRKLYSPVGIVFKGSGFYSTDAKKKGDKTSTAATTDASSKDKKPEKKTDTSSTSDKTAK